VEWSLNGIVVSFWITLEDRIGSKVDRFKLGVFGLIADGDIIDLDKVT